MFNKRFQTHSIVEIHPSQRDLARKVPRATFKCQGQVFARVPLIKIRTDPRLRRGPARNTPCSWSSSCSERARARAGCRPKIFETPGSSRPRCPSRRRRLGRQNPQRPQLPWRQRRGESPPRHWESGDARGRRGAPSGCEGPSSSTRASDRPRRAATARFGSGGRVDRGGSPRVRGGGPATAARRSSSSAASKARRWVSSSTRSRSGPRARRS
mmetsp:Transcript_8909/g.19263  ORF Transcript_8909/g.19263 Transcript_8909/m.19263 type:complete len:213 (+) Transcript_8909:65-703(+)